MSDLFPLGVMIANSSSGTIDGYSFSMAEPNQNVNSAPMYSNYVTRFQQQTMLTRKQSLPYLNITYSYQNIWQSEYQQIAHFIDSKEDNLDSFYVIDFSQGIIPTDISSDFDITLTNTRLYSKIANQKAHYVFLWNGTQWKFATIEDTSTTILTTDVTQGNETTKYGNMTSTQVQVSDVLVYPIYECYTGGETMSNFKPSVYAKSKDSDEGYMYSGSVNFVSKYKI